MRISCLSLLMFAFCQIACASSGATGYTGLGANTVSNEEIKKYAPPQLASELKRKIQAMLDLRAPGLGRSSEDGQSFFFGWNITGSHQIWKLNNPLAFPIQMTGGEDMTSIQDISPDGKYLIVARDRKGEENPGLYLQSTQGGSLIQIQHLAKIQTLFSFVSDDSRFVYFRSNNIKEDSYALYRYEIQTQRTELIFSQDGTWSILDHDDANGRMLLSKHTGSVSNEVYEWHLNDQKLLPLFGLNEKEEFEVAFGANEGEYLVLTNKYDDFRRLYSFSGDKKKAVSPELGMDVISFSIDPKRKRILYSFNKQGYLTLYAKDAKTFQDLSLPSFPNAEHVYAGASTHNGRYISIGVETAKSPRTSYVYDWETQKLTQWVLPSSPEIDTERFVKPNLEYYPSRDGVQIPMFVYRPLVCTQPCPVIVDFHGGPEGQAQPFFSPITQLFVQEGFIYVKPNVRGSDGYGKKWLASDDGPKRLNVITDIEDASRFIRTQWAYNGQAPKVGITGGSYGGYSTLVGMTMFAGAFDAGAAIVGMSNLLTFLQNTAPYRRALRISEYGDPDRDAEALRKLSPVTYIDKISGPLLIIQGVNDPRVPVGEAVQIYEKTQERGLDSRLVLFADEGHGVAKRENVALKTGYVLEFFNQHLKGGRKTVEVRVDDEL